MHKNIVLDDILDLQIHDLPDTQKAKWVWLKYTKYKNFGEIYQIYSTSKETGWDFPLEYDHYAKT